MGGDDEMLSQKWWLHISPIALGRAGLWAGDVGWEEATCGELGKVRGSDLSDPRCPSVQPQW